MAWTQKESQTTTPLSPPPVPNAMPSGATEAAQTLAGHWTKAIGPSVLDFYVGLRDGGRMPEDLAGALTKDFQAAVIERLMGPKTVQPHPLGPVIQQVIAAIIAAQRKGP